MVNVPVLCTEMQLEGLKQERTRLQHILGNQKFTPADIERINRERNELQQTVHSLNQNLEEAEQLVWNEEVNLSKTKEKVRTLPTNRFPSMSSKSCFTDQGLILTDQGLIHTEHVFLLLKK